jgi:non-ribosomal peptide synthetase component F
MTLLAAFKVALRHLSGQDDLVVGTNVAGREHAATEALIGCFINQLVLRTTLAGSDTFRELLGKVRETALAAYAHQDLPFEKLVEELNPRRDPSRALLFQVKMELLHRQPIDRYFRHVEASRFEVDHPVVRYDLHLALRDDGSEIGGLLDYDADLFSPVTAARIAGHFEAVLAAAVEDPERRVDELCARLAARDRGERSRREAELETFSLHRLKQARRRTAVPAAAAEGAP